MLREEESSVCGKGFDQGAWWRGRIGMETGRLAGVRAGGGRGQRGGGGERVQRAEV